MLKSQHLPGATRAASSRYGPPRMDPAGIENYLLFFCLTITDLKVGSCCNSKWIMARRDTLTNAVLETYWPKVAPSPEGVAAASGTPDVPADTEPLV